MNKPLKDWTAGEIQQRCNEYNSNCTKCPFYADSVCNVNGLPYQWDLTDPPRFTEQEVEIVRILMLIFPEYTHIERIENSVWLTVSNQKKKFCGMIQIAATAFPSLKVGETVSLKEIAWYTGG